MSNTITVDEYKDLIHSYADELVEDMVKEAAEDVDGEEVLADFDDETLAFLEHTAAVYEDADAKMSAALEVLAEANEILSEADGIDLEKCAAEGDSDTIEIVAEAYSRYNAAMEVLAAAEDDAIACETVLTAAGLMDDEYEDDEDEDEE